MSDYEAVIVSDDPKALRRFAISIRHDNDGDKAACRKLIERFADLLEAQSVNKMNCYEMTWARAAFAAGQAHAKLGQTTDKACSVVVPDGWEFSVTVCDGRHWLTITTPDGKSGATLSCQSEHSSGKTISAQVLELFEAAMLKGEK